MASDDPIQRRVEIHLFETGRRRLGLYRFFPPATRAELWGGLVFIAVSLLGATWVIKCLSEALALEQDSVTVNGMVVRLWTTRARHVWHYQVEYEYPDSAAVDAQVFRNRTVLPQEYFERLWEGGPVAVIDCRTDPANHQVVGERPRVFSSLPAMLVFLSLFGLLALAGVVNLWWWWISHRRPGSAPVFVLNVKHVS